MNKQLDIGIVGLAVMGRSLALNLADHGFQVGGFNRNHAVTEQVAREHPHANLTYFAALPEMVAQLKRPRKIFLMIKAGAPVDQMLAQLVPLLEKGDIVLDGGNSYFEATRRREAELAKQGLYFVGVGISGGEAGARRGPSIMPGGSPEAYAQVQPLLEAIAAKAEGEPCCTYLGPEGAGHYVKMVHNGIEYADMQLIAEAYLLLEQAGLHDRHEMAQLFGDWNRGELQSFLLGTTAQILQEPDDLAPGLLLDKIVDSAAQKGTGRWAGIESLRQGVNLSTIVAAGNARLMSNELERRATAHTIVAGPEKITGAQLVASAQAATKATASFTDRLAAASPAAKAAFAEQVRQALYAGKIIAYAQGFNLLRHASQKFNWQLPLGKIAAIFRAGCIIQAAFLNDITAAYTKNPQLENLLLDEFFLTKLNAYQQSLRQAATAGFLGGVPVPVLANAVTYLDQFRAAETGASLIQAQRDYFGAHTFKRTDQAGDFHHAWEQKLKI
jgi:6-phosphogluconate dehydrogenase